MLICVGIPCLDGKPCAETMDSLLAEQLLGYGQGVHFLVMWEIGMSMINVARNKLAQRFLDTKEAECLVFVDADISWKGGELARLAKRPEDVVGATYRTKQDNPVKFHVRGIPERHGDLMKVEGVPGGFVKISRSALERVQTEIYREEGSEREMRDFFPMGMHRGQMWGEDYGFCRVWGESGGDVWLDPSIKLRHHDGRKAYEGDFEAWIKKVIP